MAAEIVVSDLPPLEPGAWHVVSATMSPGRIVALYVNGKRHE